ncbi:hypothetical protein HMPREF1986_01342 [Oribacterium sp. oral taxon 078 str. F0263]|nr:hypothetical protein HMPREF1986_01342 [Oribacterium sp. oral taxon 078 str. F0263]
MGRSSVCPSNAGRTNGRKGGIEGVRKQPLTELGCRGEASPQFFPHPFLEESCRFGLRQCHKALRIFYFIP